MKKKKLRRIRYAITRFVVKAAVLAFVMLGGAGCYHAYLLGQEKEEVKKVEKTEEVEVVEDVELEEAAEQEAYVMTEEDLAEEAYCDSLELLAICVEAEAGNQGLEGKRMVVDVILNRVEDSDWPDTIEGVISQKYQFSSYWDGGMDKVVEPSEETFLAVQMELEERGWPGIYYFTAYNYSEYGTPWKKVGDHYFSLK